MDNLESQLKAARAEEWKVKLWKYNNEIKTLRKALADATCCNVLIIVPLVLIMVGLYNISNFSHSILAENIQYADYNTTIPCNSTFIPYNETAYISGISLLPITINYGLKLISWSIGCLIIIFIVISYQCLYLKWCSEKPRVGDSDYVDE